MSGRRCEKGTVEQPSVRFTLIGLATTPEFQQCLAIIEQLYKKYPLRFPEPIICPMLEFGWIDYLTKAQRLQGGTLWHMERSFIILANNMYLGTEDDLEKYLMQWFHISINKDFDCLAQHAIVDIYKECLQLELYCDIVPKTCRKFIKKCSRIKRGYRGTRIHRIMKNSWIQCADFSLPTGSMSNENYIIPHNKRGVISMCNNGKHKDNKTQFFITLDTAPWMDYRYVAFGQLLEGEHVLHKLENLPTTMEYPNDTIVIGNCGEITMEDTLLEKNIPIIEQYIKERGSITSLNNSDVLDAPSIILEDNYRNLLYCYIDDTCSRLPMNNMLSSPSSAISICASLHGTQHESEGHDASADWNTITVDELFYQQFEKIHDSPNTTTDSHVLPAKETSSEKLDAKSKSESIEHSKHSEEPGEIDQDQSSISGDKRDEQEKRVPPNSLETDDSVEADPELETFKGAETSENTSKADFIEELSPDSVNSD